MSLPITLIIIETDPRSSHKPAEGIRLAAGLQVWKRTEIQLLLCGMAPYCLQEFHDECRDEDNFTHYLPMIRDAKLTVCVDSQFPDKAILAPDLWPFKWVELQEIAHMIVRAQNVIRL